MSDFGRLITDAQGFLAALNADNSKPFWDAHKPDYEAKLKTPALALLEDMTAPIAAFADCAVTGKLFRPHRDVRFSKDKTPYKIHLHMMWTLEAGAREDPVFFFGIGLDYVTIGAGRMGFETRMLADWREMLDLDCDRMLGVFDDLQAKGFAFREPALKRVPAPYPADHPAATYLRMKGAVATAELSGTGPLPDRILTGFKVLWPLNELLISIASD